MKSKRYRDHRWLKHIPTQETIVAYRFLKPVSRFLDHHSLWQFNRRSVAGGAAVGLFFALAIPVAQIPLAAIVAIFFRVNIPVAVFGTLLSNPFTTPAILFFAYKLGAFLIGHDVPVKDAVLANTAENSASDGFLTGTLEWFVQSFEWLQSAGWPLIAGLGALSVLLSIVGYVAVHLLWRLQVAVSWKKRCALRKQDINSVD